MADSETTNTIVLVRQDLLFHISNVSKTYAVIEENNKSVKRNLRDGLNALKVAFSGQKPGEEKKDRPETKRIIGCSVILWYRDTSMCFINCQRSELPAKLDEYELATDFDHVFKFGAVNINSNKRHRWVDLYNDKDGSITWRALFDIGLSGIQPVLPEAQPQLYPPMGVSCKLETTVTDYLCLGVGFQIVLFNLRATELVAPSGTNGLDLYLKIHGSFLNEETTTSLKRKVFEATWDEAIYLNPIFLSAEYLARKHLVIELRTVGFQVEEELLGTGVLSLDKSFSAPEEFRVSLTSEELPVGWIYGCVHTRIVPPQR